MSIKIDFPSSFSASRSIHPTDALMHAIYSDTKTAPIPVHPKTVLGVRTDRMEHEENPEKFFDGNPQRIEIATLPADCDTLGISYGLMFTPSFGIPALCNSPSFLARLREFVSFAKESGGIEDLARLYAINVANARWGWKNRDFADLATVHVTVVNGKEDKKPDFTFDALAFKLRDITSVPEQYAEAIDAIASVIADGLSGDRPRRLKIEGRFVLGQSAQVYPSQEFADASSDKDSVGKILFSVPSGDCFRCAAMHEQKIGNAIRTIDIWHGGSKGHGVAPNTPLPINAYAQDRTAHAVLRNGDQDKKNDFYSLTEKIIAAPFSEFTDEHRFLLANLIKGGVYGFQKSKKKVAAENGAKAKTKADAQAEIA